MIGLWSLVPHWLESQSSFYVVTTCASVSVDHRLLPLVLGKLKTDRAIKALFVSSVLLKTTVTSYHTPSPHPHALLLWLLYIKHWYSCYLLSVSQLHCEPSSWRWVFAYVLTSIWSFSSLNVCSNMCICVCGGGGVISFCVLQQKQSCGRV